LCGREKNWEEMPEGTKAKTDREGELLTTKISYQIVRCCEKGTYATDQYTKGDLVKGTE